MSKLLDYYTVTAERETGFWIGLPIATGRTVARDEWVCLMTEDPGHFGLATFTTEELTGYSVADDDVVERAVFGLWSDEILQ